jgi:hypothetical protein
MQLYSIVYAVLPRDSAALLAAVLLYSEHATAAALLLLLLLLLLRYCYSNDDVSTVSPRLTLKYLHTCSDIDHVVHALVY